MHHALRGTFRQSSFMACRSKLLSDLFSSVISLCSPVEWPGDNVAYGPFRSVLNWYSTFLLPQQRRCSPTANDLSVVIAATSLVIGVVQSISSLLRRSRTAIRNLSIDVIEHVSSHVHHQACLWSLRRSYLCSSLLSNGMGLEIIRPSETTVSISTRVLRKH